MTETSSNNKPSRLPLIPLSPLTQTSIEYAKALAQTTKSLSETISSNSKIVSLLNKDLSQERENLDRLTKEIQDIQSKFLFDLNTNDVAKEIAYINCCLFRLVVLNRNWISNFDKQSNIVPLLDFHRYLSHSFAHQIIYSVEEDAMPKRKRKSYLGNNTRPNAVAQSVQIAYILLYVYRDFSGCSAILSSLRMPEVQRLEKLWTACSTKIVETYKELVIILSPTNNYEAYHHHLWLHTFSFINNTTFKSQMIAVPFMQAHLALIRNLVATHAAVMHSQQLVLSDAGKKQFDTAIHVLEFCQQHYKIDPTELERPVCLVTNLDSLHPSPTIYHWIVSRPYLNRIQLHQESLQVEPLAVGEIDLEAEEEYDLYWDFFTPPTTVDDLIVATSSSGENALVAQVSTTDAIDLPNEENAAESASDDDDQTEIIITEEVDDFDTTPVKQSVDSKPQAPVFVSHDRTLSLDKRKTPLFVEEITYDPADDEQEEEEEEEEWTGYPIDSANLSQVEESPSQPTNLEEEEEEEEWTGYPMASQDEDEDEEEVWKGYPVPQEYQQHSPKSIDLSSPSTPQEDNSTNHRFGNTEEWKGYERTSHEETSNNPRSNLILKDYPGSWDNKKLHAIGKAAARKMQYSVSQTDNRKRLPSMFVSSTST